VELKGAGVLVTGASRGLGVSLAEAFAAAGARVALVARTESPLEQLAARVGGSAHPADLADPAGVGDLIAQVEQAAGPIDVLVNNAGLAPADLFTEQPDADIEQLFRVNVLAAISLCRQAVPRMRERGRGHVVNISSLAGISVFPGMVGYSATKAALSHFTAGLRADLRGLPIGTTLAELGPIPTDMRADLDDYPPTKHAFRRAHRIGVIADVPADRAARAVVRAVRRNRRHVRRPRRTAALCMLSETPRRFSEVILSGVASRAR
jgi:uncharacterized protein